MTMPDVRSDGPPRVLYDSVRAGPHRPFLSGTGESGLNASIIHVVYDRLQLYPQYVIEFDLDVDPAVLACTQAAGSEPISSAAAAAGSSSARRAAVAAAPPRPLSSRGRGRRRPAAAAGRRRAAQHRTRCHRSSHCGHGGNPREVRAGSLREGGGPRGVGGPRGCGLADGGPRMGGPPGDSPEDASGRSRERSFGGCRPTATMRRCGTCYTTTATRRTCTRRRRRKQSEMREEAKKAEAAEALWNLQSLFARAVKGLRHGPVSQQDAARRRLATSLQQDASDAGVFEADVAAMRSAPDGSAMQHRGCSLMDITLASRATAMWIRGGNARLRPAPSRRQWRRCACTRRRRACRMGGRSPDHPVRTRSPAG